LNDIDTVQELTNVMVILTTLISNLTSKQGLQNTSVIHCWVWHILYPSPSACCAIITHSYSDKIKLCL